MQIFLLSLGCVFLCWQAKSHNNLRLILLLLVSGIFLAVCRELDDVLAIAFPFGYWKIGFVLSIAAVVYAHIFFKKAKYMEVSFSKHFMFYIVSMIFFAFLLIWAEIVNPGWGADLRESGFDLETIDEEIMEAACFLPIFLLFLNIYCNHLDILDRFYAKYGKDAELTILSRKETKIVFNVKTMNSESILVIIPNISVVQFFKYVSSQGMQQLLYENGFNVAKMEDSYLKNGSLIYVQQKIKGSDTFLRTKENMYRIGEFIGKLHSATTSFSKYGMPHLYIKHPNVFFQMFFSFKEYFVKRIFFIFDFRMRHFPRGICHRDIDKKNVVMCEDGSLALIDFDVHRYQPFVEGLVRFYVRNSNKDNFFPFIKGYNVTRPLTDFEKEYLEKKLSIKLTF